MFITFEGIDGSGKSTQIQHLAKSLRTHGQNVVVTREPGGAPGAELIRRLLVEGDPERWSPVTEALLFTAARRDHLERTILPELAAGNIVLSDRFADSTRVYQGAVRSANRQLVDALHDLTIAKEPDLTIILDMPSELAHARGVARNSDEDRFEEFGADFQARLRTGFHELAKLYPERCVVIDANRSENEIAREIADLVVARLQ